MVKIHTHICIQKVFVFLRVFVSLWLLLLLSLNSFSQKKQISTKDSLDGAFDLSDYIIEAHGFVPVPIIITEPSLGGFGGGIVPVFIKKRPSYIDTIKGKAVRTPIAPDITGLGFIYTVNNTWGLSAFRSGTLVKSRIKYMIGGGYTNVNMSFYRDIPLLGEKKFKFNFHSIPAVVQATKRIGYSHWYAGLKYFFLKTDVKYTGDPILPPDFVTPKEYSSIISRLSAVVELDDRDNIFTPNKGAKIHLEGARSDDIFGSDYDFWRLNYYLYAYHPVAKKLTGGWRLDGQQAFGNTPFYMLPFIDMRGIPANRYQGNADLLTELELRWDFIRRWSVMFYGGTGKAFNEWSDFGNAEWVYSYGTGFRYLLARKFGLRVGIDVARGSSDTWAYYIVFGSNWLK